MCLFIFDPHNSPQYLSFQPKSAHMSSAKDSAAGPPQLNSGIAYAHALDTAQMASPGIGPGLNLALGSIDNSFGPIPAPFDKACKLEVMHRLPTAPLDDVLQRWLDRYVPPKPKARVGPSYFERKRAELVARKARVDALMALRAGSEKYGRRWPRFRQIAEDKENARRAVESKRKQDLAAREQAAKAALVRKEERAAADARVAVLMRQRTSGRGARRTRGAIIHPTPFGL
ncbi:hypothetical protein FB451DRAFT_1567147 [Mycena latifolia]|nr:hypothetical protein FB451DRAFT_1567147 [Mycena latifolia]